MPGEKKCSDFYILTVISYKNYEVVENQIIWARIRISWIN